MSEAMQCEGRATWCEQHQRCHTVREQQICDGVNVSPSVRRQWLTLWGGDTIKEPQQSIMATASKPTMTAIECEYRRPITSSQLADASRELKISVADDKPLCDLCGSRGKPFEMFWCEKHDVVCTMSRKHSRITRCCLSCPDATGTGAREIRSLDNSPEAKQHRIRDVLSRRATTYAPIVTVPFDRERLKTHILYHVHPIESGRRIWMRHLHWLNEVVSEFNGRVILGVTTPGPRDTEEFANPDEVRLMIARNDVEVVVAENEIRGPKRHEILGECVTFRKMLALVQTRDHDDVCFYGHCKGVTHASKHDDAPPHRWARAIFDGLFRHRDAVIDHLEQVAITGNFRMRGGFPDGEGVANAWWFYSGTFFAFRSCNVFARQWRNVPPTYGGVERWPAILFDRDTEAGCLSHDGVGNLYEPAAWS